MTRKVSHGVARIRLGLQKNLKMGNLEVERDWGFAGDYVEAMWLMLQQEKAQDFVIATGVTHSVRDLLEVAFAQVELDYRKYVEIDPSLLRPAEVHHLRGDCRRAERELGWKAKSSFEQLIRNMVDEDLARLSGSAAGSSREQQSQRQMTTSVV